MMGLGQEVTGRKQLRTVLRLFGLNSLVPVARAVGYGDMAGESECCLGAEAFHPDAKDVTSFPMPCHVSKAPIQLSGLRPSSTLTL